MFLKENRTTTWKAVVVRDGEVRKQEMNCNAIAICDSDDNYTTIKCEPGNWEGFLSKNLSFPFNAVIDEYQETGFLKKMSLSGMATK